MRGPLIASCLAISVSVALAQPRVAAIVNSASFQAGLPMGGGLATMFVSGLTPPFDAEPGVYTATSFPLPYQLGGVSISIYNGLAYAPILAVSIPDSGSSDYAQINFQVPIERNVPSNTNDLARSLIVAFTGAKGGAVIEVDGALLPPPPFGAFFADAKNYVIAQHGSDYSPVTPSNPAHAGETIIAYADDFFSVWPGPPVGVPAPLQPPIVAGRPFNSDKQPGQLFLQYYPPYTPPDPITHLGGGYFATTPPLTTTFLGLAPGQVGVEQVNFIVPTNQQPGDWALFFNSGSASSPSVLLPVR